MLLPNAKAQLPAIVIKQAYAKYSHKKHKEPNRPKDRRVNLYVEI
jgi:hypothetical protein